MSRRQVVEDSRIGRLTIVAEGDALVAIEFDPPRTQARAAPDDALLREAARQLAAYLEGELREFSLPLAPRGTDFQLAVWSALAEIPYGHTCSYAELAARIGRPRAMRAVGAANGRNPLPIVLPCHRVIGAGGSLVGYGGGLERKSWLLELEAARSPFTPTLFGRKEG